MLGDGKDQTFWDLRYVVYVGNYDSEAIGAQSNPYCKPTR